MLTGKNTKPQQAVNYFMEENSHEVKNSRWFGKGAEKLGLTGAINDKEIFTNIVNGRSPDGSQTLYAKKTSSERLAATDFTFSAPKSVSLQALVGGDERLIQAHSLAVQKTLKLIESRYSFTRTTTDTGREPIRTRNLVIAEFDHIESRELDPHLHTHTLIMNMTGLDDEKWQSLSNREIFKNKKFLGMVYQHHLASEVQRLGYKVEPRKHGQFEIKGFREEDLEEFSKRRQQILKVVGKNSTWAEREGAWSITRAAKQKIAPDELKAKWQEEAEAFGIQFIKWEAPQPDFQPRSINQEHLEAAIAHCSERNVSFTQEDLEKFILEQGLATDVSQIEPLIQANPELLSLSKKRREFTTLAAVNRELTTIKLMQSGQGKVNQLAHPEVAQSHLETTALNRDQRRAVLDTTTTTDQFTAWQGVAGAGKTFALKELKAIAATSGYTIKGFAPSSMAAKVLGEELDIQAETVARLLVSEPLEEIEPHQIWVVDEAGLLSAKDALALLERAELEQARVLLVGDTKQLSAVEAGNPFKSLQQAGIKTSYLNESNRQRAPKLKLAVDLIASGSITEGFNRLDENGCIETVTAEFKVAAIANEYITATPEQRAKTLVLAGTNRERLAITQAIREHLKAEGNLGTNAIITQLQAKDLTLVQKRYTHNFEKGDMIMPTRNYKRRGLSKGKLYKVVHKDNDSLTLKDSDGKHFQVDTGFDQAVYQSLDIEIAVGDRLRWTKNDRQLGRRNGQEFVVKEIAGSNAQIQYLDNAQTEIVDLKQAQHLDYALVSTTYSSQGKTADRVLIAADHSVGQESFYVAVSRARYELKLYTEDKEDLLSLAQSSKAKENALFLLRQKQLEKEQNHDLNHQQSQHSATIRNNIINSEDGSTVKPPRADERENRAARVSEPRIEAGNPERRTNSSSKFERVLRAISRHLELEEVEQLEGHLRELNRSLASNEFRDQRTAQHPDDTQQLNTASLNNPKNHVSLKSITNGHAINAISDFLDNAAIESAIDIERLQSLIRDLQPDMSAHIHQATQHRAIIAITQHLNLAAVESSALVQKLGEVLEQLKQSQTPLKQTAIVPPSTRNALNAIADFVEQEAVSSALVEALPSVTEQLATFTEEITHTQPAHLEQTTQQAIMAIAEHIDLAAVESPVIVQKFREVIEQLKQLSQPTPPPLRQTAIAPLSTRHALNEIANFVEQEALSSALAKALPSVIEAVKQEQRPTIKDIPESSQSPQIEAFKQSIDSLTNQELLYLEQAVQEYFSQPLAQKPLPIDRPAIEHQINQLQQKINSLWVEHAQQEKAIKLMERLPLHQLSNKYNSTVNKQLQTISTIQELFTQKQQLETSIKQWETQAQNYQAWEREEQTIDMKTITLVLQSTPLQERLSTIKNELLIQEQHKQSQSAIRYQNSQNRRQSRGLRR